MQNVSRFNKLNNGKENRNKENYEQALRTKYPSRDQKNRVWKTKQRINKLALVVRGLNVANNF